MVRFKTPLGFCSETTARHAVSNYHLRMSTSPRYLTKSRFKLALECPTKLYYTGKPEYLDTSLEDSFLAALAEGGHQVGALACVMYPGGIAVTGRSHAEQLAMTRDLLQQEDVTLYEAAFEAKGLFVRVDVLRKQGNRIELIEVKAKSYNPLKDGDFRGKGGALKSDILPYLQDIAFQRHVAGLARPEFEYQCFLMLADSSRQTSVAGLNQRFKLVRKNGRASVEVQPGTDLASIGDPILNAVGVGASSTRISFWTPRPGCVPTSSSCERSRQRCRPMRAPSFDGPTTRTRYCCNCVGSCWRTLSRQKTPQFSSPSSSTSRPFEVDGSKLHGPRTMVDLRRV